VVQEKAGGVVYKNKLELALESLGDYRQKLQALKFHLRPIQFELVEGTQFDVNWEKFADALFDLLGEPSSEAQYKKDHSND
jgi:hypothetical protein